VDLLLAKERRMADEETAEDNKLHPLAPEVSEDTYDAKSTGRLDGKRLTKVRKRGPRIL
jgi:hypothetical protein